jgi:integrase
MTPNATLIVREQSGRLFFEATWRHAGKVVKRRVGPAWLDDSRQPRKGRVPEGYYDEPRAHVRAAELVAAHAAETATRSEAPTFREVAHAYLQHLEEIKGAKPSTLYDYRSMLAEPDDANGVVIAAIGDTLASEVTTRQINELLAGLVEGGASARTCNKYRSVIGAIFNHGMRTSTFGLPSNPAKEADRRRQPEAAPLDFYTPAQVELLARACEDPQDQEIIRVAAFTGLRLGEQLALQWGDVDFAGQKISVRRAMSAGVEGAPKSWKAREVPLAPQAAEALERLRARGDFTGAKEYVFCNVFGRPLDGSALRRRYRKAQAKAKLEPLRLHDLRHTFGSLLAASGVDLVAIQSAMGHSDLATTSRYLHARAASTMAERFGEAFAV